MTSEELRSKFSKWLIKLQYMFLENDLFQPIGLELSCVNIEFETKDDYTFNGIDKSEIDEASYPLAYYRPDTDSIHVFIEHEAFNKRYQDSEKMAFLMFILFHEANHRLLLHIKRGKDRDHTLWNIASDMEIHNMFYVYNEVMKADRKYENSMIYQMTRDYVVSFLFNKRDPNKNEGLWEEEFLDNTAEEIYTTLQNSKQESSQTFTLSQGNKNDSDDNSESQNEGKSITATVKKTTYKTPSGKKFTTTDIIFPNMKPMNQDGKNDEDEKEKEAGALTRKTLMENTIQKKTQEYFDNEEFGHSRGTLSDKCKSFLKKLFHVKIDWKKILRNSLQTALEKSEYFSWEKLRTSLFGMPNAYYLPGQIDDECAYGTVIIARDESGSMSDEECEKAAGIIADSKEYYKKVIIIKHNVNITSVKEIDDMNDESKRHLLTRDGYGGTSHNDVFEYIKKYSIEHRDDERISCCIFITDMESDIESTQTIASSDIPRIYLTTPRSAEIYKGKVNGKIIPIEL